MSAPKSNKCALVRAHIKTNPGCTYAEIAAGIGIPSNKWLKDVRKMVARGLVLCEEREGVRHHSIGREPTKVFGLTPEQYAERKRVSNARYCKSPEGRTKRNERRRKAPAPASVRYSAPASRFVYTTAPAPRIEAQTVEDFLASGGQIERLPTTEAPIAYGRRAA